MQVLHFISVSQMEKQTANQLWNMKMKILERPLLVRNLTSSDI